MSSQLTVIIAGIVLVVAIVVALVIMRRGDSRFTYDTQHGTAPRATEGEGNTAATAFKGRFSILTTGVGAMFAALAVKLWGMQMVSSDYYEKQANSNQTRTVTTPAVRGRILDRNGVALVQNRPSLAVVAYRDLAEDEVLVRHLANVLGMPYVAVLRNIQDNTEALRAAYNRDGRPSLHGCLYSGACRRVPGRQDCRAYRAPVSIWRDGMPYLGLYRHHYLRAARGPE